MPFYRLSSDDEPKLIAQPETGMGFQVIFAGIFPGREGRFLVLSCALVLPARDREELRNSLLELAEVTNGEEADLDEVPAERVFLRGDVRTIGSRLTGMAEPPFGRRPLFPKTTLVVERGSAQPHLFFRFSPRRRDPRVDSPNYGQAGGGVEVLFLKGAIALHGVPHLIPDF